MKFPLHPVLKLLYRSPSPEWRHLSSVASQSVNLCNITETDVTLNGQKYSRDERTNITPKILTFVGRNLHNQKYHPLFLIKERIKKVFYSEFTNRSGNPLFSVYENLNPVVSLQQNFESLLVAKDHDSRKLSCSYYLNSEYMLRAHTTAHDLDLIFTGLDNFLIVGDVYRRDNIDRIHFPVFHQVDGVRLRMKHELFEKINDNSMEIFETGNRTSNKQQFHTLEAVKLMEYEMKNTLGKLAHQLFGKEVEMRWVDAFFPFTHPSWELEVHHEGAWLEVLGCGILEHDILQTAGVGNKIGWAFGLGLDRLAMKLYSIPDIRLFWSNDSGFLTQFYVKDYDSPVIYKSISRFSQCINDIAFWIPEHFCSNDFYDLVRTVGGDLVEQVSLIDSFFHPKHKRFSRCYRIVYRHMEKTLTQEEVNKIHNQIELLAAKILKVEVR